MQEQPTCLRCGDSYDPTIDYSGREKTKRSGRPRQFCSRQCVVAANNTAKGDGGERAWPRSKAVEETVCAAYLTGESCNALAEAFETSSESIRRVLRRSGVTIRDRNAPTPRKLFKGGRIKDQHGYVCVLIYPDEPFYADLNGRGGGGSRTTGSKYVPEHRLVMSRALGRPVRGSETVHHKNGARDDNRIENLELWAGAHSYGQRAEDLIAFVVENYPAAVRAALDGKRLSLDLF